MPCLKFLAFSQKLSGTTSKPGFCQILFWKLWAGPHSLEGKLWILASNTHLPVHSSRNAGQSNSPLPSKSQVRAEDSWVLHTSPLLWLHLNCVPQTPVIWVTWPETHFHFFFKVWVNTLAGCVHDLTLCGFVLLCQKFCEYRLEDWVLCLQFKNKLKGFPKYDLIIVEKKQVQSFYAPIRVLLLMDWLYSNEGGFVFVLFSSHSCSLCTECS